MGDPLLHPLHGLRHGDVHHQAQRAQIGFAEPWVVEERHPDELERGEGGRASLPLELVERLPGFEESGVAEAGAPRECAEQRLPAPDVKEGEWRPEAVFRGQSEASGAVLPFSEQRRMREHAALRVGGRARRVEQQDWIVRLGVALERHDLVGVDQLRAGLEVGVLADHHDSAGLWRPSLIDQLEKLSRGEQNPQAGVVHDVGELVRLVARVDRHAQGSNPHRADGEGNERLAPLPQQDSDSVAGHDTGRTQQTRRAHG